MRLCFRSRLLDGNGLGQVARAVDVAAAQNGDVVREQLHGNDREHSLQAVDRVRHFHETGGVLLRLDVAVLANDDRAALASRHLLQSVDAFLERDRR